MDCRFQKALGRGKEMSDIFLGIAWIKGTIAWLLTVYYAFLS
jgi:hypothetical protein